MYRVGRSLARKVECLKPMIRQYDPKFCNQTFYSTKPPNCTLLSVDPQTQTLLRSLQKISTRMESRLFQIFGIQHTKDRTGAGINQSDREKLSPVFSMLSDEEPRNDPPTEFLGQVDEDLAASMTEGKLKRPRPKAKKKSSSSEKDKAEAESRDWEIRRSMLEEWDLPEVLEGLLPEHRRQLQIERDAVLASSQDYRCPPRLTSRKTTEALRDIGLASNLSAGKRMMLQWFVPTARAMAKLREDEYHKQFFQFVLEDQLAVIALHAILGTLLRGLDG